jgi:fucose permease
VDAGARAALDAGVALERKANPASLVAVYGSGLVQGLTLVSFPASSAALKHLHGFSDAQYGAIFFPQVALVILGSVTGGMLEARLGLRRLLLLALACGLSSQVLLAASLRPEAAAPYALVLGGTAFLGFSFGVGAAPLNGLPPRLSPQRPDASITLLHTLLGAGLSFSPLLAAQLAAAGSLAAYPAVLAGLCLAIALPVATAMLPDEPTHEAGPDHRARPWRAASVWLFLAIALLYGVAEGTFGNWVLPFLTEERGLPMPTASLALSAFWASLAVARLLVAGALERVAARKLWLLLPAAMAGAFLAVPLSHDPFSAVGLFALAGATCSGVVPLTVGLASRRFPQHGPWVSALVVGAITVGVGGGSIAIGPLRSLLPLERLYPASAAWPLLMLALMALLARRGDLPR